MPTNNNTVFIIFGIVDKTMKATLSLLMLNVTDPLNITLNEKYEKLAEIPEFSQEIHEIKPGSQGKTIGIAVGVTVAVSNKFVPKIQIKLN